MDIKEKIVEVLRKANINFNNLYEDNYDEVTCAIKQELPDMQIAFDSGLSKLVILIPNEEFVIKIPYSKLFDEDSYNADHSYWDSGEAEEDYAEPLEENYFVNFECATSDKVETSSNWDYCELECAFYEAAYEEGLAQYFAKEELYSMILDQPIYIQERVIPLDVEITSSRKTYTEETKETSKRCDELDIRCFNSIWITDFFNCYGEEEFIKLSKFLKKMSIYDLHSGNLGYLHGAPVLLDYSDFREW